MPRIKCLPLKQDIGLEQSQKQTIPLPPKPSPEISYGFGANWKRGQEVTDIGNSWRRSARRSASPLSQGSSKVIGSPLALMLQENTCGSLKQELKAPNSSTEVFTINIVAPFRRNTNTDWERIRSQAIAGDISECPPDVYIRCYNQLKRIVQDHQQPVACVRTVKVFWGVTGSGKSYAAWDQAGLSAYGKDPRTKWWCGYRGKFYLYRSRECCFG